MYDLSIPPKKFRKFLQRFTILFDSFSSRFSLLITPDPYTLLDSGRIERANNNFKNPSNFKKISFPKILNPEISIVITLHNKAHFTQKCLESVYLNTEPCYELIIIDDCSTDETEHLLSGIENIRIFRNETNSGIIKSRNKAIGLALGRFIVFLDNDIIVTEKWLEPLVACMKDEHVGAVGPRLIYPDGTLKEAGGIIWADGSTSHFGRGDGSAKPRYNYVRPVDFCSGVALIVRKDLLNSLGGFDSRYEPGHYEDTDLCLSIWVEGYRVMYQPQSLVIHFGDILGNSLKSENTKFQMINMEKFYQKWKPVLERTFLQPSESNKFKARTHRVGKYILVIDHHILTPDRDSGSHRMSLILQTLLEQGHSVTFIEGFPTMSVEYTDQMQQEGIEVLSGRHALFYRSYLGNYGKNFDLVILSRLHVALKKITSIKKYCPDASIIYDTVDVEYVRQLRRAIVEGDIKLEKYAQKQKKAEFGLLSHVHRVWTVSGDDQNTLLRDSPYLTIDIIPDIYSIVPHSVSFDKRSDLLFVGGFNHLPNSDAVIWFLKDIFPLIRQKIPEIRVFVVGENPPQEIRDFSGDAVIITGYVKDISEYFRCCRVFIVPLRYGAGLKGKVIQSMAHHMPLVTTTIGAEGTFLVDGQSAFIADEPEEFARKVILLYQNHEIWEKLSSNSQKIMEDRFSNISWKENLKRIIDDATIASDP